MAKDAGADVLVTHHPVIFQPKRRLLSDDPVWALCRSGLAAVSVHTPWDCAEGGVSDVLCGLLGLEHVRPVPSEETAVPMVRLGDCAPCAPQAFAKRVAAALGTTVQLVPGRDPIRSVAVCGHELLAAADSGKTLVAAGHFATEAPSMAALQTRVQAAFPALRTVLLPQTDPATFVPAEG